MTRSPLINARESRAQRTLTVQVSKCNACAILFSTTYLPAPYSAKIWLAKYIFVHINRP